MLKFPELLLLSAYQGEITDSKTMTFYKQRFERVDGPRETVDKSEACI